MNLINCRRPATSTQTTADLSEAEKDLSGSRVTDDHLTVHLQGTSEFVSHAIQRHLHVMTHNNNNQSNLIDFREGQDVIDAAATSQTL